MLDTARHDDEFTGLDPFRALLGVLSIVHAKAAFHDQKHLVFIFVMMPGEGTFEFPKLDQLAVELARDALVPVIVDERKFFGEVDFLHFVGAPTSLSAGRGGPKRRRTALIVSHHTKTGG